MRDHVVARLVDSVAGPAFREFGKRWPPRTAPSTG